MATAVIEVVDIFSKGSQLVRNFLTKTGNEKYWFLKDTKKPGFII